MSKINKSDVVEIFNHVKEECVKDPFYFTKLLIEAFGKNVVNLALQVGVYIVAYYILTNYLNISYGVSVFIVLICMISYHSALAIIDKIKTSISNKNVKSP